MKVLDLHCGGGHAFEGWFVSEADFVSQCDKAMVQCPICGDTSVRKKPSAPRLNLSNLSVNRSAPQTGQVTGDEATPDNARTLAWLAMAHQILAHTTDVGSRFAEEARKMHYREIDERGIRGTTTADEARSLREEGIDVLPFAMPEALKGPMQ